MGELNGHDELSVVGLLEFLGELDSTRNPPVYDIGTEKIFSLEESALPDVAGGTLAGTAASWLTVEYLDLPVAPVPPIEALSALPVKITALAQPEVPSLEQLRRSRLDLERRSAKNLPPETVVLSSAQQAELRTAHSSGVQSVLRDPRRQRAPVPGLVVETNNNFPGLHGRPSPGHAGHDRPVPLPAPTARPAGLSRSAAGTRERRPSSAPADPVNAYSGELWESDTDLTVLGRGPSRGAGERRPCQGRSSRRCRRAWT